MKWFTCGICKRGFRTLPDPAHATLIVKGKKTFADVPDKIKAQVKDTLEALDCGELAQ